MQECPNAKDSCTEFRADCSGGSGRRVLGPRIAARRRTPGPARRPTVQRIPMGELPQVDVDAVLAHTKVLSSDQFEGRAPGGKGEELTVGYLVNQFKKIGLKPGNPDGTYIQKVPLVGITASPAPLVFRKGSRAGHAQMEGRPGRGDEARRGHRSPWPTPSSSSSATASSRPSTTGTTTRAWTSRARRS